MVSSHWSLWISFSSKEVIIFDFFSSFGASESLRRVLSRAGVSSAVLTCGIEKRWERKWNRGRYMQLCFGVKRHKMSLAEENPGLLHGRFLWSASWAGISQSVLFDSSTKAFEPSTLVVSAQEWTTHQLCPHLAPWEAITPLHEPVCYLSPFWNRANVNKYHSIPLLGISASGRWLRMGRADSGKVYFILLHG